MADNDQFNDEYQLADMDGVSLEPNPSETTSDESVGSSEKKRVQRQVNVKRNAIIALAVFMFAIVAYKFVSSRSTEKKQTDVAIVVPITPVPAVIMQPHIEPQTTVVEQATLTGDNKISQKLSSLELSQQSMRDDVVSVNSQLGGINNNVREIMTKMAEVSRVITNLSAVTEAQSHEIERLIVLKAKPPKKRPPPILSAGEASQKYYIQAVIPGRAWLMATNGTTLTVREGTSVAGYGIVKLIDPIQGRVMTSSGQMIRFSQEDS